MDERLKLTKEQLEAVKKYNEAVKGLRDANIACILKQDSVYPDLYAINGKHVYDVTGVDEDEYEDEEEFGESTTISLDEVEFVGCPVDYVLSVLDESFRVEFM